MKLNMTKASKRESTQKATSKLSGHEEVVEFMRNLDHPLKECMEAVREIILGANKEITEHIKWRAPSFCVDGDDRVTFNLHKNEYILLVFHRGAKVKNSKRDATLFEDTTGLLEWVTNDRAIVKLHSLTDVNAKKVLLTKVINQWIAVTVER